MWLSKLGRGYVWGARLFWLHPWSVSPVGFRWAWFHPPPPDLQGTGAAQPAWPLAALLPCAPGRMLPCPSQEACCAPCILLRRAVICPDVQEGEDSARSLLRHLLRHLQQESLLSPADASHSSHHADGGARQAEGHGLVSGHGEGKEPPPPPPEL